MARVKFVPRKVATPKELQERWEKKKNQIEALSSNIERLRRHVSEDLKSDDEKKSLTALAIALIDKTGERVGNEDSASNGNFGVTGLRKKHIAIKGDTVTLTYRGKSGVLHDTSFSSSKLATALKKAIKNSGGIRVFQTSDGFRIKNDKVNRYLATYDISAKDIRGFRSNDWIIKGLTKIDIPKTEAERKKTFLTVLKKVAEKIGHGKSTLRNHYMIPEIETSYINDGKIIDISDKEKYEKGGKMKVTSDGKKGGLLRGPTDKGNGKGIPVIVESTGQPIVVGGGEKIIVENAKDQPHTFDGKKKTSCEILSDINVEAGGVPIACDVEGNTSGRMLFGGKIGAKTGDYKGRFFMPSDGNERFEISDTEANIIADVDDIKNNKIKLLTINKFITHSKLFSYYPEFNKIKVIFEPIKEFFKGELSSLNEKQVAIIQPQLLYNKNFLDKSHFYELKFFINYEEAEKLSSRHMRELLLERTIAELQHAIQLREGFGAERGLEDFVREVREENERSIGQIRNKILMLPKHGIETIQLENEIKRIEASDIFKEAEKRYRAQFLEIESRLSAERIPLTEKQRIENPPKYNNGGKMDHKHSLEDFEKLLSRLDAASYQALLDKDDVRRAKLNDLMDRVKEQRDSIYFPKDRVLPVKLEHGDFILPKGHIPFMKVANGGSSCASCKYLSGKKGEYVCTNKYYQNWEGTDKLPDDIDNYCSDWWEPKR